MKKKKEKHQRTFVIRSRDIIKRVSAFLEAQPKKPLLEVIVREHKKKREVIQNSLYWLWLTIIANELGMTKECVHYDLKHRILCRIYERDDIGYAEMIRSIRTVRKSGFFQEYKALVENIVNLTSTTTATVQQFAEYLTEIERDMIDKGISLPHKEDQYYDALMIKH